jgi:hypothetical protein
MQDPLPISDHLLPITHVQAEAIPSIRRFAGIPKTRSFVALLNPNRELLLESLLRMTLRGGSAY